MSSFFFFKMLAASSSLVVVVAELQFLLALEVQLLTLSLVHVQNFYTFISYTGFDGVWILTANICSALNHGSRKHAVSKSWSISGSIYRDSMSVKIHRLMSLVRVESS